MKTAKSEVQYKIEHLCMPGRIIRTDLIMEEDLKFRNIPDFPQVCSRLYAKEFNPTRLCHGEIHPAKYVYYIQNLKLQNSN